jgi:hypothetical protein
LYQAITTSPPAGEGAAGERPRLGEARPLLKNFIYYNFIYIIFIITLFI